MEGKGEGSLKKWMYALQIQTKLGWDQIPALPLTGFVMSGKLLSLSVSQFLHF